MAINKFSWHDANSVQDAVDATNRTVAQEIYEPTGTAAVFKSGGIDVLDLVKEGLMKPATIVNVLNIPGLDSIEYTSDGQLRIGANVTLAEIESSEEILQGHFALHQAVASAATPQLRNMSTIGGNIAQRTRCWYFRSNAHKCLRKQGDTCYARNGENENHAILKNGGCVSVHASSISTALLALNASLVLVNDNGEAREVSIRRLLRGTG